MELIFCGNTGNHLKLKIGWKNIEVCKNDISFFHIMNKTSCRLTFFLFQYWIKWKAEIRTRTERRVSHGTRSTKKYIRGKSRGKN